MGKERPETLGELIEFGFDTLLAGKWTASPAEVISYDSSTKRIKARIIPVEDDELGNQKEYPILTNVPVMFPSGGGFTMLAPIGSGDTVLLVFCRRGISNFKSDFTSAAESGGVMQVDSAIAIPCFGSLSVSPSSGLSLQKNDGSVKVEVLDSDVEVTTGGTKRMAVKANGDVEFGDTPTVKYSAVIDDFLFGAVPFKTHIHTDPVSGVTGAPIAP